ncbi:putative alanine racemase-domain-containing protein [Suillus paluster]|uniref:putative alanine racemase-domain-containing protein n=1 Tax=Suillus paluster TaxID=48578 RepID=UPI001B86DAF2|nr:putative alanine racemase-domain-containing protein [Suillus paluster]KAG1748962.1 putative alanine racemase-domain-containing protein [Suillus paluster]
MKSTTGNVDEFPAVVARHFADVFLKSDDTLREVLPLDLNHPPESFTDRSLVRFHGMVQDTSSSPEMYLASLSENKCGGWGISQNMPASEWPSSFDYCDLKEATALWAVTVPGQTTWRTEALTSQSHSTSSSSQNPPRPHKFPVPNAPHIGVQVKIYDNEAAQSLKATDVVTFIGILTSESLDPESEAASSPMVPSLHVLCHKLQSTGDTPPAKELTTTRDDLIKWIADEALGGDEVAAQWLVLELCAKVYIRATPLLLPSLTLSRFPSPAPSSSALPTLHYILSDLLPQYLTVPLSLDLLNKENFSPESKDEDLHSGYLQVPHGTTLLLTENNVHEGKLVEKGIMNIKAIQEVMDAQTLEYSFPFSKFPFPTDIVTIVLCEGWKSAFFQTGFTVPLEIKSSLEADLYKPRDQIKLPDTVKLAAYRSFLAAAKQCYGTVQVAEETSRHIQEDFVRHRQEDPSITADDLIHSMKVARMLAASMLEREVTIDIWERSKRLDADRRKRSP